MDVLALIKAHMLARGWSEYKLAQKSGVAQSTINSLFRKNNNPSISTLESICAAFGITLSQFFAQGEQPEAAQPAAQVFLQEWAKLPDEKQQVVIQLVHFLAEK